MAKLKTSTLVVGIAVVACALSVAVYSFLYFVAVPFKARNRINAAATWPSASPDTGSLLARLFHDRYIECLLEECHRAERLRFDGMRWAVKTVAGPNENQLELCDARADGERVTFVWYCSEPIRIVELVLADEGLWVTYQDLAETREEKKLIEWRRGEVPESGIFNSPQTPIE